MRSSTATALVVVTIMDFLRTYFLDAAAKIGRSYSHADIVCFYRRHKIDVKVDFTPRKISVLDDSALLLY